MRSRILDTVFVVFALSSVVCCGGLILSPGLMRLKGLSVVEVLRHGHSLAVEVYKSWNETAAQTLDRTLLEGSDDPELMRRIVDLGSRIRSLEVEVQSSAQQTIGVLLRELPSRLRLELRLDALSDMMTKVNVASEQLQRYVEYEGGAWRLERHTVQEFAEWAVSHQPDSVLSLTERMHSAVAPAGGEPLSRGILALLGDVLGDSRNGLCDVQQSPQQLLYNIYSSVALTDLRGYAMIQFSWMLLRHYNKGNFTLEAHLMRERYEQRRAQKISAVRAAMKSAARDIYRCDPRVHEERATYERLTRLLQGHIENEVDINAGGGCWQNCAHYPRTESHGCYMDQYCAQQPRCEGTLHDCTFYDSDMWVCRDQESPSDRRYDWVAYEDGTILGEKGPCRNTTTKVDSWWRWLFWHCSYCLCLCDQQGPESDRYFSLRPALADIQNNSVVTGLRLVKHARVMHLQVQQGALLPWGAVDGSTLAWLPVEAHSTLVDSSDLLTMSYDRRAVDLDDVVAPPDHVLTGVRFRAHGGHLALEIMATPLDFPSGVLSTAPDRSAWVGAQDSPRTALDVPPSDVPTRSDVPSVPDSRPGQFVLFGASDAIADAAQSTVPFLDAQPVGPQPPTLLSGAGVYHKGRPGSAGFVAPKLFTYDYSPHMISQHLP